MRLGFLGVGTIASAVIEGLMRAGSHEIVLSPRSAARGEALAARWPGIVRAGSNAEVASHSDLVFLAMKPAQLEEALEGVEFSADQTVVSFVTGLSVAELQALAPASRVARVLPLPFVRDGQGPVLLYPALPVTRALFGSLGDVIEPRSEEELMAMGGVSGFMSSFFSLCDHLARWLEARGVPPSDARLYVASMLAALGETGRTSRAVDMRELIEAHETAGGLNQRVREHLRRAGWFDGPADAMAAATQVSRQQLT